MATSLTATAGVRRARAVPPRAHRPLLPDARLAVRGRGRRAGDAAARLAQPRPVRGPLAPCAAGCTASPPTSAWTCSAAGAPHAADGHRRPRATRRAARRHPARGHVDRAGARPPGRRRTTAIPPSVAESPRVGQARVRRRAPAPAAAPARGAHPLRGPQVEGQRGRRAARDQRRVGQQRAPARAGDARRAARSLDVGAGAELARRRGPRAALAATSRRSSATTSRRSRRSSTRTRRSRCRRTSCGCAAATTSSRWWVGPGAGCRGSKVIPTIAANGSPAFAPVQAEPRRRGLRAVGAPGRSRSRTARSPR